MLTALISFWILTSLFGSAQDAASAQTPQTGVVLVKLSPPLYPPLARQAMISGEVKVELAIRKDGGVESAKLFSGHPMLAPAALESAKTSQFECAGCGEAVTSYLLTFAFELRNDCDCCNAWSRAGEVTQSHDRVTVSAPKGCLCDPTVTITRIKWRSAKCLYLWHCESRVVDTK